MNTVQTFRNRAEDCRQTARLTPDAQSRATWNSMAERWLHCADLAERLIADAAATVGGSSRTRKMKQWSGS
jgi:hypothetical protein